MRVRQVSKENWNLETTDEDRKILRYITDMWKEKTPPPSYGKWIDMNSEDIWKELVIQFCVFGGAKPIENLSKNIESKYEFFEKLSLDLLSNTTSRRQESIASHLKDFKATRFYNKAAKHINDCVENVNVVRDGKVVLLDDIKDGTLTEDDIRDILLERLSHFKMKSVSDFMITIGAARNLIAFDTRVVGLLNMQLGLNVCLDRIRSSKKLYKALENGLKELCRELSIELSHLDRLLFQHSSEIEQKLNSF